MDIKNDFSDLLARLKTKYPDVNEDDLIDTIEFAVNQYRRLSKQYEVPVSEFDDFTLNWIKRACYQTLQRIFDLGLVGGVKQYSENGYQFTLDGSEISIALQSEIIPQVGYAK